MSAVPGAFEQLVDDLVMGQPCPACCAPAGTRCGEDQLHKARRSAALAALVSEPDETVPR